MLINVGTTWRSIVGVFIPAIAPKLVDRQQQEMAALDQGGKRAVEVRSLTNRIAGAYVDWLDDLEVIVTWPRIG